MNEQQPSNTIVKNPSISLPKGGGAIKGIGDTFKPHAFSGTGSFSIPFPTTSARGFEPHLALNYNSGSGNSPFGLGFDLSIPKISIRTSLGIPKYDGSDIFLLNGAELVPKNKAPYKDKNGFNVYEYLQRIEGTFSLIKHHIKDDRSTSFWEVISTTNTKSVFGKTQASQVYNPEKKAQIFEWLLTDESDAKGNKIIFEYKKDNEDNLPEAIWAREHVQNNKYPKSIKYGNYNDQGTEKFAFEVRFNYGEYNLKNLDKGGSDPYTPIKKWDYRPDPFSSYRSGFEIRTSRLCKDILLFHHLEKELGDPYLVKSLSLSYSSTRNYQGESIIGPTTILSATLTGYRRSGKTATDKYDLQAMPSLNFGFSEFCAPQTPQFNLLSTDVNSIPGHLNASGFMPVDLNREGISGLLYSTDSLTYLEPEGDGKYNFPETPNEFPISKRLNTMEASLTDLEGNGEMELVTRNQNGAGYYPKNNDGTWGEFTPFASYPSDFTDPLPEAADLNGNGKSDLVVADNNDLLLYNSLGKKGYSTPQRKQKLDDFPLSKKDDVKEHVGFADLLGDGLQHRIKITNGNVECWPDLGYGNFDKKISLGNAPLFDGQFETSRLFLADIDGSGTTDLIYVYPDRVELFINQSGNSFSNAITITLPETFSDIDQISFADILGNGTSCLVFTKIDNTPRHYYYNFIGEIEIDNKRQKSIKPYLLNTIANNLGAVTQIQYCSSTKFYLEDKKDGNPWITKLPFPVQVVEKTIVIDKTSGTRYTNRYKYHDGFYDHVEREFRGFGYVESWDTEDYDDLVQNNNSHGIASVDKANFVPPVYTRTWYHTGATFQDKAVTAYYKKQFFQGDDKAYDFPEPHLQPNIYDHDVETVRQAYVALKGQVMRTEVYGEDKDRHPLSYQNPITVEESNVTIDLYQKKGEHKYAVFMLTPREGISYQYEREAHDPRIQQHFTLETDHYGNVISDCTLFLPRRSGVDNVLHEGQQQLLGTYNWNRYVTPIDGDLFCHQGCEQQQFQLLGISLSPGGYMSYNEITTQTKVIDVPSRQNIISYSGQAGSGVEAQQMSWHKSFFWDANLQQALDLGSISPQALLHHEESAVFDKIFATEVSDGRLIAKQSYTNQDYLSNTLYTKGGYFYDEKNAYWWNKGLVQMYLDSDKFYLPNITENRFAFDSQGSKHPQDISLCTRTTITYDDYYFTKKTLTQLVDQSTNNVTNTEIDYVSFQPKQLTDINNNVHQALYDPLGRVIVSSIMGTENGTSTGGMSLYPKGSTPAAYQLPTGITFDKVTNRASQKDCLKGAASFFYYNLHAWKDNKQPASAVQLQRFNYWNSPDKDQSPYCMTIISYTDGLGRELEKKTRTSAGMAYVRGRDGKLVLDGNGKPLEQSTNDRWQTAGRTVSNNKGKPYEQYLPYFIDSPLYQGQQEVPGPPPTVTIYDALNRVIRVNSPKGFFSKVEFTPWEEQHFDEDDTIIASAYYKKNYPNNLTPQEKEAIDQAKAFYNTPHTKIFDNTGSVLFEIDNNLGNVQKDLFKNLATGGITSADIWNALKTAGYLASDSSNPDLTWVTPKFQPYIKGFQLKLPAQYSGILEGITELLKQNGLVSSFSTDILGRVIKSIDSRLYFSNITSGTNYCNFQYRYAMDAKEPVRIDGADAGSQKHFINIFNQQLWSWSARDYCQLIDYDQLQRKTALYVKKITTSGMISDYSDFNLVEVFKYGETQNNAEGNNLRGQLYELKDLSGIVLNNSYSMQEEVMESSRQMAVDYKNAINWKSSVELETEVHITKTTYNAVKHIISNTSPDKTQTSQSYNETGQLISAKTVFSDNSDQQIIDNIAYDAKGQRTSITYGNGIKTAFTYEDTTLRLTNLISTRNISGGATEKVQDLDYTYDPVGNVTQTVDNTISTVFHANQKVEPKSGYVYDALYRLIKASGRQHININENTYKNNSSEGSFMQSIFGPPPPTNDSGKLENYTALYTYDDGGNLIEKSRSAKSGKVKRSLPVENNSNQLKGFSYDPSGNMRDLVINGTVDLSFNCCENLVKAATITRPNEPDDADYYVYDSNEQRTRKVSELSAHGGTTSEIEDKIYLGNYEIKRDYKGSEIKAQHLSMERQILRIMDGNSCVAIINYISKDKGTPSKEGSRQFRFQMDNHLGSVSLEMDKGAQLISYEEYFPYGGTSIITGSSQAEVKLKEYRYSGKERDNSTGLYYYGARYYASWLGRWLKPDPGGAIDGMNLYAFVGGNPISKIDNDGHIGLWAALATTAGIAATLGTGVIGGLRTGNGLGNTSGATMGAIAGVVGATVGGLLVGASAPVIATAALATAAAGVAGAISGGSVGRTAMDLADNGSSIRTSTVGALSSAVAGGLLGFAIAGPIGAAAGAGGGVLSSGAHLGLMASAAGQNLNPRVLTDATQIVPAVTPHHIAATMRNNRQMIVMAPQQEAMRRFRASYEKRTKKSRIHPNQVFRLNPNEKLDSRTNPAMHIVAVHGSRGYVMVSTGHHGNVMRPMAIADFARYVDNQLGHADNHPIKFVSCYGGAIGIQSNAQVLANITGRTVHAFPGAEDQRYAGPWKEYTPQH